jgi:hypothetical protein
MISQNPAKKEIVASNNLEYQYNSLVIFAVLLVLSDLRRAIALAPLSSPISPMTAIHSALLNKSAFHVFSIRKRSVYNIAPLQFSSVHHRRATYSSPAIFK